MKKTPLIFAFLAALVTTLSTGCPKPVPIASPTCETFDVMLLAQYGTVGGTVSNPAGSTIFSVAGGVPVSIHKIDLGSGLFFNFAGIETAPASFGSGKVLNTNNVCIELDFSAKNVKMVSVEFRDLGGKENLWVNGMSYAGEITAAPATLGGASVTLSSSPLPGGKKGKVTVRIASGNIKTFRIGGQEFHLDNLCYQ